MLKNIFLAVLFSSFAFAGTIGPELHKAMQNERGNFPIMISFKENVKISDIIKYYSGISKENAFEMLKNECEQKQVFLKDLCERMELEGYVSNINIFWIANAVSLNATREAVEELALQQEVDIISLDLVQTMIKPFGTVTQKETPWGLGHIKSRTVNAQGFTGEGVTVAVVDTGIDFDHPAFASGQILADLCVSFVDGEATAEDGNGHGSHCAGTIASQDYGVAPGAKIIGVKVLSASGSGSWAGVMKGVEYAAEHADVLSLSLGGRANPNGNIVEEAVKNAIANGVVLVIAAGNDGPFAQTIGTPGVVSEAITVGAIDESGELAYFSSRGETVYMEQKPEIVAPGVDVLSAWKDGGTNTISGTSMATPHVAGLVALLLGKDNTLTPEAIKNILMSTANGTKAPNTYGEGTVQCDAAINAVGGLATQPTQSRGLESSISLIGRTNRDGILSFSKNVPVSVGTRIKSVFSNASYTDCQITVDGKGVWEKPQAMKARKFHPANLTFSEKTVNIKIEAKNGPKNNAVVKFLLRCTKRPVATIVQKTRTTISSRDISIQAKASTVKIETRTDREGNIIVTQNFKFTKNTTILDMYCNASYEEYQVTLNGEPVWENPASKINSRTFYPIKKSFDADSIVSVKIEGKKGPINNARVRILFRLLSK